MKLIKKMSLLLLLFAACQAPEVNNIVTSKKSFFDIKSFFIQEIERLKQIKTIEKTITLNGQKEVQTVVPNFKIELSEFLNSDINKVSWKDKYDEIKKDTYISYSSLDESLEIKTVEIFHDIKQKVKKIRIIKEVNNLLYTSHKELLYDVEKEYYSIKNIRNSIGQDADTIFIKVLL